jgi:hypothetical protein
MAQTEHSTAGGYTSCPFPPFYLGKRKKEKEKKALNIIQSTRSTIQDQQSSFMDQIKCNSKSTLPDQQSSFMDQIKCNSKSTHIKEMRGGDSNQ